MDIYFMSAFEKGLAFIILQHVLKKYISAVLKQILYRREIQ